MSAPPGLSNFACVGSSEKFRPTKGVRGLGRVGVVQSVAALQYLKWASKRDGDRFFSRTYCDKVMVFN